MNINCSVPFLLNTSDLIVRGYAKYYINTNNLHKIVWFHVFLFGLVWFIAYQPL